MATAAQRPPAALATPGVGPPLSRPTFDVSGANFIITGGTQGLGLEIARQLKACGASSLALLSRTRAKGEKVVAEMSDASCTVHFVEADMTETTALQAAAAEAIRVMGGRVDGLVNAAASADIAGSVLNSTLEMWNNNMDTNVRAPFLLTQTVAKHLVERRARGAIVNISSSAAKGGASGACAYAVSKGALNTFTQNSAMGLAPHGIRVNGINMGWTLTDTNVARLTAMNPDFVANVEPNLYLKRFMQPVDVACMVCFLLSPAAEMATGNTFDLHPDTCHGFCEDRLHVGWINGRPPLPADSGAA